VARRDRVPEPVRELLPRGQTRRSVGTARPR
jgi:hypothetical protein